MLDVTFGGGMKALGDTSNRSLASVRQVLKTARRPYSRGSSGVATIRNATSRWNMSVMLS